MGSNNEYICIILSYCSSNFYSSNFIKIIKGFKINLKSSLIHVHSIYIQGEKNICNQILMFMKFVQRISWNKFTNLIEYSMHTCKHINYYYFNLDSSTVC